MKYLQLFSQPSSLAGFAMLLAFFGVPNAPEALQGLTQIAAGLFGIGSIFRSDNS